MTSLKSKWKLLAKISADGGCIIISDEQNFPKYLTDESSISFEDRKKYFPEMKDDFHIDLLEQEVCVKKGDYSGYSIPWLGGDGTFPLWGRYVQDSNSKDNYILNDLIVLEDSYDIFYTFNEIDQFEKLDYTKCSIQIYSGKIGIDSPDNVDERGLIVPSYSYDCPIGNGTYNIFELQIESTSEIATLVELNPNNTISKKDVQNLLNEIAKLND
jgi:hypothetical protein